MNKPQDTTGTLLKSTDLFAYLDKRRNEQKSKADAKRLEQRDAQLMAEMHDECKYIIEDIIDKVKMLEAEYHRANAKGVARRKEDSQSEANEGRYPPLPLLSCSPSAILGEGGEQ